MSSADITSRLARYMVEARSRNLPTEVAREAKHRILDTLAAMVSGARLKPGEMAIRYARGRRAEWRKRPSSPPMSGPRP
jgi:2-methylcitrate dehydratase PrpD